MLPSRFLINLTTIITLATSICFLPNGTSHDDQGTQPCSLDPSSPLHNTCCHSKWENAAGGDLKFGQPKDECLPNGLCQNRGFSTKEGAEAAPWTHFYRVYCTNKDWEGCLSVCDTGLNAHDVVQLTPCDGTATSEKWCCGDTTNCCLAANAHKAVVIPRNLTAASIAASRNSSSGALPKPSARPDKRQRDIGLGVGIGLGLPIVFGLGVALGMWLFGRRRNMRNEVAGDVREEKGTHPVEVEHRIERSTSELETPRAEVQGEKVGRKFELP